MNQEGRRLLVTGATGYIGGRLVPRLLDLGYRVRCLVRDPARLLGRPWQERVEIVAGDVLRPESLGPALEGVDAAYYLVHSLAGGADFHQRDLTAASNFGAAARAAGVAAHPLPGGPGGFRGGALRAPALAAADRRGAARRRRPRDRVPGGGDRRLRAACRSR